MTRYKLDPFAKNGISPEVQPKVIQTNGYVSAGKDGKDGVNGTNGSDGADGADGVGVVAGGTTGQALVKKSNTDYDTEWKTVAGGSGVVETIVAGTNITVDATDPANPIVSASGGSLGTDELVKLSATDATAGYLDAKLQEGIQVVKYDTTPTLPTITDGMTYFNEVEGTLSTKLSTEVTLDHGRELHFYGKASGNIANGDLCQFAGVQGDHILIKKCVAAEVIASPFILVGVATETFTNGNFGRTTWFGKVNGVYTKTPANQDAADWVAGDALYFSNTTGQLTKTAPVAPEVRIELGFVIKEATGSSENGIIEVAPEYGTRLQDLDDVNGTTLDTSGQIPVWDNDNQYFDFTENIHNYRMFSGFENRTDSTLAIDSGTGVFTLAPAVTSFNVWTNTTGKHIISDAQTVTVTDDQTITYIYIDGAGDLQKSTSAWDLNSGANAPCAIVFKDGTNYTLTDERHSYERNKNWHSWAHFNIGAMYHDGLVGTFDDTTLSVTQGVISDEDIRFDTGGTKTAASLWYRNATNGMRLIRNSTTPYRAVAGVLQYDDGSGTLQPVNNAKYVNSWVYCSNDPTEPIYIVIGQAQYATQALALASGTPAINLSTAEWKLLYKVIYQNDNGTPDYKQTIDFRTVQTGVPTSSVSPTSHTTLADRDATSSHPISAITDLQSSLDAKVDENAAIVAATKTKITYDAKGLVTVGADATTADIADSSNKRYVSDAQLVVIGNTSNTNTGDETQATIKTKLGAATSSVDGYATSTQITKLDGIAAGAEVNVQADWTQATNTADDYIKNKPTIPTQYTDEMAQDAVGGMVNTTLTYTDGTPELKVSNPVTPQATGFTISAGTTPKTLTVSDTASITGTNTGDNAANTSIAATKLDDFATPDDNTDLNANTTNHGLLLKATAPGAGLYNYVGITNGETAYTNKALFDATVPSTQAFGDAAAAGSATVSARRDHKHAMPALTTILGAVYPVGCIYTTITATNPATVFGFGTWEAFGAGRVLVGLNGADATFDTAEETGGVQTVTLSAAQSGLPAHSHEVKYNGNGKPVTLNSGGSNYGLQWLANGANSVEISAYANSAAAASSAHSNLQPYIVVYFFKRTA